MSNEAELKSKFWKALKSDRTTMLGLVGSEEDGGQPMTAQIEGDEDGPIWFFTAAGNDLVEGAGSRHAALLNFASKGHELFAKVEGDLSVSTDRATIERLWNPFVAAWFEGKDDPKIRLLRFDPREAQIWLNENSLFAGLKMLFGSDPKKDYADKTAEVRLN
ncbi:general stress protein [Caulobacter sp. Root1455]|uniref:pyridoxamine 5'-phosphate oxidase family protein n=1 Tax=unclassified Caulobacter TaxID=2648921 RepID=UPI0006F3E596|nr:MULTISPECIES: pyridoxamine 5'-phosphate oxidase family protein [unclassified Caulobacter]KQY30133.1 general stress protein [Caulobacter sp. Root487D2Y]KQY92433.1 general stress protein [Caulobacter sp. Root1455]